MRGETKTFLNKQKFRGMHYKKCKRHFFRRKENINNNHMEIWATHKNKENS